MAQGQQTTYVGTLPQKRTVSDRLFQTEPMEFPLFNAFGVNADAKFKFVNSPGTMYEWLEDTYSPISDTCADTGMTNVTNTTTVAVTDGTLFQAGDVTIIDTDYIWVASVATNTLTVVRGFGGGTPVTHASTSTIYIRSRARLEGATAGNSHYTQPTTGYNYSQIFQKSIEISRSDSRLNRYGIANLVEYEIDKKMKELQRDLTRLPYYGKRAAGTATTARGSGGLDTFISTNLTTLSGSPALTQKNVEDSVQTCWDNGGSPNLLVCGAWAKRKICDMYTGQVQTLRNDTMGGVTINRIMTQLGIEMDVLVDRFCPTTKIHILQADLISFVTIDEFFYEDLGKTKDTAAYGQIVGEYGFAQADQKKHAMITGISTSL